MVVQFWNWGASVHVAAAVTLFRLLGLLFFSQHWGRNRGALHTARQTLPELHPQPRVPQPKELVLLLHTVPYPTSWRCSVLPPDCQLLVLNVSFCDCFLSLQTRSVQCATHPPPLTLPHRALCHRKLERMSDSNTILAEKELYFQVTQRNPGVFPHMLATHVRPDLTS